MRGIDALQDQQAEIQKTQLQLASGLRVNKPSDDPSAAVKVLDLNAGIDAIDQYAKNSVIAQSSLGFEENVVANVQNTLQRIRELTVQGNNATNSDEARQSISQEIYQRLDELIALANTRDAQGDYIFAGFKVDSPPFVEAGGVVSYQGDQGQRMLQVGSDTEVATRDSGTVVFQQILSGDGNIQVAANSANNGTAVVGSFGLTGSFTADTYTVTFDQSAPGDPITYEVTDSASSVIASDTYTDGAAISFAGAQFTVNGTPSSGDTITLSPSVNRDMFTTVREIADALARPSPNEATQARFHNEMGQGLSNLDQALEQVSSIRAGVGARLNRIETMDEINQDFKLQLQTTLSETQDLDYAEAIARFNLQLTSLEAAQQAYIRTTGLSLFRFL